MKKASIYAVMFVLIASAALSLCATVRGDSTVSVYILDPYNPANGSKGLSSGGHWVGQIPIRVTEGSTIFETQSYCMHFDRTITIGGTYTATLASASDSAEWRAVSYVLTWNNPATDMEGAAAQVAVWRLLNQTRGTDYYRPTWLTATIDSAGDAVATQAWGRDVVRAGDQFRWVSPITGNMTSIPANPAQDVVFTAQLTSAAGQPRSNVLVQFNATLNFNYHSTLLNSTYVTPSSAYTDNQGRVQVTVKVPSDAQVGSSVGVEAATKSVWPQRYIDLTNPSVQDLIGVGDTFQLTVSTNMTIYGFITVLPESPIGPIAAIAAFGGGFAAYTKIKQHKKPEQ